LRQEVEAVLGAVDRDDSFLNSPAIEALANAFESSKPGAFADRTFGPYRTTMLLGVGGMGEVYHAQDTRLNRSVAIKFLSSEMGDHTAFRRFQQEARLASSLNHPHILTVHEVGEFEG
jgi:serine/threonine protein kinase